MGKLPKFPKLPKKEGLDKVTFWVVILLSLLFAALGLRVGAILPKEISVSTSFWEALWEKVLEFWQNFRMQRDQNRSSFLIAFGIVGVGFAVISYLVHRHKPKKRKGFDFSQVSDRTALRWLLYLAVFGLSVYGGTLDCSVFLKPFSFQAGTMTVDINMQNILSFEIGIFTAIVVGRLIYVLQDVYVKRNSKDYTYFEENKKSVLLKTTALGMILVGFFLWIPDFWGFTLPQLFTSDTLLSDLLGYYTAMLSLTFISISVMGVLSDRSVVIYWENIAEGKLIKPVFGSFAAYTYYSVGAALGAGVCVALLNATAFIFFCIINIITLVLLTYTMVDVYYDRESKKVRRRKELEEDTGDYLWYCVEKSLKEEEKESHHIDPDTGETFTVREIEGKRIGYMRYSEKMMLLCQNISRAQEEHDLVYLQEVYELYQQKLPCFNTPDGKRVVQLLFANCTAESWPLMIRHLRAYLENEAETPQRNEDPFLGNAWKQDEELWAALGRSSYLRQWLQLVNRDVLDTRELEDFLLLVFQRLILLYNDMVTHTNLQNAGKEDFSPKDYGKVNRFGHYIEITTEDGRPFDCQQIADVFSDAFHELVATSNFSARPLRVLFVMLETLSGDPLLVLQNDLYRFPLAGEFTDYLHCFGFTEEEKTVWNSRL